MKHVNTEEREKKILSAIVETYIETAMPVGSRTLAQHFRWTMSPATIRNVMASLEEKGLIMHPHTSAGRVPTDRGYRVYVNDLLEPRHLTKEEESFISRFISKNCYDMDALMQSASKAVSMITNVAGIVITPRFKRSVFKKVEFIPIDSQRILTVLVTGTGLVKNTMLEFEEEFTVSELERMAEFLNEELEGMFLGDIRRYLTRRLLEERDSFYSMLEKAIDILSSPGILRAEERLYFDGATSIMSCPEFRDISKARLFLRLLEEKSDILEVLNQDMDVEGIKVHIGRENPQKSIQDYTIVTSNYKINDTVIGAVGAIGPTRVEYGKVISAVDYIAGLLGEALEHLG